MVVRIAIGGTVVRVSVYMLVSPPTVKNVRVWVAAIAHANHAGVTLSMHAVVRVTVATQLVVEEGA